MKNNLSNLRYELITALSLTLFLILPSELSAQAVSQEILAAANYRAIGSTRHSGRVVDFAVYEKRPETFYVAFATGGLWKTVNNGITFESIFDDGGVISIGDIAIDQNNPDIIWLGSGEANNSRTQYYGDGVYKSVDGGKNWKNMGLKESHHIGRVVIHPKNSDIVWVAAAGHLYSENPDRGLYETRDGGKSWKKILEVKVGDRVIGITEVALDPSNPDIMYAASYDKVRRPWTFNTGGPGSAIYKSKDGGKNWTKLTEGLPTGVIGKIGIEVSRSNPNIVYTQIENNNIAGMSFEERYKYMSEGQPAPGREMGNEVYRSDDKGSTWRKVSPDGNSIVGGTPYYYQQVRISATNPDIVYVLGTNVGMTENGGKEWKTPFNFGGDNHALWLDPADPNHILLGYDHGMGISYDNGKNWYHPDFLPVGQFVAVSYDFNYPYNVYGGLQDNGSVMGPSTKRDGSGINIEDWRTTGGGDGMFNVVDLENRYLYTSSQNGPITRIELATWKSKSVRYPNMDRWAWNHPIVPGAHNSNTLYHAGNKVVRSLNNGESWEEISGDLTTQDQIKIAGTGNIQYCTIVTMEESTVKEGVLWVGVDDGKVWVTPDAGKTWNDVTGNIPGHPGYWVSRVATSNADASTAYVTITGHRNDDFRPFVYKTTDMGKTWKSISSNLPVDESICVIREHPANPNLLFVGSTKAVYVSFDGGAVWNKFRNNMPNNPVEDIKIHPREKDIIVGTHGRSIFIADISYMEEINSNLLAKDFHLFAPETKVKWQAERAKNSSSLNYNGPSEPVAANIYFYLKNETKDVKIQVLEGARVVYESTLNGTKGVNKFLWPYVLTPPATATQPGPGARQPSVSARPGNYTIRLIVNGKTEDKPFTLLQDRWL